MTYLLVRICKYADDAMWRDFLVQAHKAKPLSEEPRYLARNIWKLSLPDDVPLLLTLLDAASSHGLQYEAATIQEDIVWSEKKD